MIQLNSNRVYKGSPWCLGFIGNYEINRLYLITLLDHDYVIWRDDKNNMHALDNICRHMGGNLSQGQVKNMGVECPMHGHIIKHLHNGTIIIEGREAKHLKQATLPLHIVNNFIWTYGLDWKDGNTYTEITPKDGLPNYCEILGDFGNSVISALQNTDPVFYRSETINKNILIPLLNFHDVEHFCGSHKESLYISRLQVGNIKHSDSCISWEMETWKKNSWKAKLNLLIPKYTRQYFYSSLPGFMIQLLEINDVIVPSIISMYPETQTKTRIILNRFFGNNAPLYMRAMSLLPQLKNLVDRVFDEDMLYLGSGYTDFDNKIMLKNDKLIQLAHDYLHNKSS